MTYRERMIKNGGNLSWCVPYRVTTKGGDVIIIAENEGNIVGCQINGRDVDGMTWERIARMVNPDYDLYSGWEDRHIAHDDVPWEELECRSCPWFDVCDAMDEEY